MNEYTNYGRKTEVVIAPGKTVTLTLSQLSSFLELGARIDAVSPLAVGSADGTVTVANGLDSWGGSYGYYIQIDHGGGLETLYAHCSSICVTTGQQVQAGQVIGYVGHTGRATGSHLHFEIHINKIRKDAMSYFGMQY